ncbi:MAG: hypothetical protein GX575_16835 [Candidatus Anammoximicrobium sp.]|nr:hypothetical protein [Candidatus Anammoximicrobium sp.]
MQADDHLLTVLRYVERNPLRAHLAECAEAWRWGSAWARIQKDEAAHRGLATPSDPALPRQWRA